MASWSESNPDPDEAAPTGTGATTAMERACRLLKQLFVERPRDERPPVAKS
jgi:hypothetical protein